LTAHVRFHVRSTRRLTARDRFHVRSTRRLTAHVRARPFATMAAGTARRPSAACAPNYCGGFRVKASSAPRAGLTATSTANFLLRLAWARPAASRRAKQMVSSPLEWAPGASRSRFCRLMASLENLSSDSRTRLYGIPSNILPSHLDVFPTQPSSTNNSRSLSACFLFYVATSTGRSTSLPPSKLVTPTSSAFNRNVCKPSACTSDALRTSTSARYVHISLLRLARGVSRTVACTWCLLHGGSRVVFWCDTRGLPWADARDVMVFWCDTRGLPWADACDVMVFCWSGVPLALGACHIVYRRDLHLARGPQDAGA
jgi:hypothetical protein